MPPVAFEPAIPASVRPQTHALDRAATGIGNNNNNNNKLNYNIQHTNFHTVFMKIVMCEDSNNI
jgi:hypothetical protein